MHSRVGSGENCKKTKVLQVTGNCGETWSPTSCGDTAYRRHVEQNSYKLFLCLYRLVMDSSFMFIVASNSGTTVFIKSNILKYAYPSTSLFLTTSLVMKP